MCCGVGRTGLPDFCHGRSLRSRRGGVIGIDFDEEKVELARTKGVIGVNPAQGTDSVKYVLEETYSHGADAVLITASAKTDEVIHKAAEMSRKRGRIVLVGVIEMCIRDRYTMLTNCI